MNLKPKLQGGKIPSNYKGGKSVKLQGAKSVRSVFSSKKKLKKIQRRKKNHTTLTN